MMSKLSGGMGALLVAVATIASATVALCLGHIGGETYVALVGPFAGTGVGVGIFAAGVSVPQPPA